MNRKHLWAYLLFYASVSPAFIILYQKVNIPRDVLYVLLPVTELINLGLIIAFITLSAGELRKRLRGASKRTWFLLGTILVGALLLRGVVAPKTHRILYDEDIYLNIAQNIANEMRACLCDYGAPHQCFECIDNKQPFGFSTVLAVFFKIFGVSEPLAFWVAIFMNTASVALIFTLAYILTDKQTLSLYSALLLALMPLHIIWSATVSIDGISLFFNLLAAFTFIFALKNPSWKTTGLAFVCAAYATQIRPESVLIIPILGVAFLLFSGNICSKNNALFTVLLMLLIFPNLMHIKNNSDNSWGAGDSGYEERFDTRYIWDNLRVNGGLFLGDSRFPLYITLLTVLGSVVALKKYRPQLVFFGLWWALYFSIFLFFYAGSFNYGADVRFSLNLMPGICFLAGIGMYALEGLLRFTGREKIVIPLMVAALLLSIPFYSQVHDRGIEGIEAMLAHDFGISQGEKIGSNALVLSHVAAYFLVNGNNAAQPFYIHNPEAARDMWSRFDEIYFYDGFWCQHSPPHGGSICAYIRSNYNLTFISSYQNNYTQERLNYTLYRIK